MENTPISNPTEQLNKDGFAIARNTLSLQEVSVLRSNILSLAQKQRALGNTSEGFNGQLTYLHGDLTTDETLQAVLFDPRIIAIAKTILGPEIVYFGDSSCQIGRGARGLHRDNVERTNPNGFDWDDAHGNYGIIRIALYLQDHKYFSGGVKFRKGSHLKSDFLSSSANTNNEQRGRGSLYNMPSQRGDAVIWTLRTIHSGNTVRLRFPRSLALYPTWENRLLKFLPFFAQPEEDSRISLFMTFARPGKHLDHYLEYTKNRQDMQELWRKSRGDAVIDDLATKAGVRLIRPISDYGSLWNQISK